jgi:hypothetical protein
MSYFQPIDKEEQLILLLALHILEKLGNHRIKKIQALRFIRARGLADFHDGDFEPRSNGEDKWMNDFSWAREDAKERGFLSMPDIGIWRLTDAGRNKLTELAEHWKELWERDASSMEAFLARCRRINECTFSHMLAIASGIDVKRAPGMPVRLETTAC